MSDPVIFDPAYIAAIQAQTAQMVQVAANGESIAQSIAKSSQATASQAETMASLAASQASASASLQAYDEGIVSSRRREELSRIATQILSERMTASNHPDMDTIAADALTLQLALDRVSGSAPAPSPVPIPSGGSSAVIALDGRSIQVTLQDITSNGN